MVQSFVVVLLFVIMVAYVSDSWGLALLVWALIGILAIVFDSDLRRIK